MKMLKLVHSSDKLSSSLACVAMAAGMNAEEFISNNSDEDLHKVTDTYEFYSHLMRNDVEFVPYSIEKLIEDRFYIVTISDGLGLGRRVIVDSRIKENSTGKYLILDPESKGNEEVYIPTTFYNVIEIFPSDDCFTIEDLFKATMEEPSDLLSDKVIESLIFLRKERRVLVCLNPNQPSLQGESKKFIFAVITILTSLPDSIGLKSEMKIMFESRNGASLLSGDLQHMTPVSLKRAIIRKVMKLGKPAQPEIRHLGIMLILDMLVRYTSTVFPKLHQHRSVNDIVTEVINDSLFVNVHNSGSYYNLINSHLVTYAE